MRILITGGAGFIGHNVALYLRNRGFEVVVVDSLERSSPYALRRLSTYEIPVVNSDVRIFDNYEGFDIVIHAAAYVSVEESIRDPVKYFENNVVSTARVGFECAKKGSKLIYLSSAAVYGEPVEIPVKESHKLNPKSPYGLSKLMSEQVLKQYADLYELKHVVLRLFNVYGPGQNPAYAGAINSFIDRLMEGKPPIIYGDGAQTRDFIYVIDVARVIESFIEEGSFNGAVYNVGSGEETSINALAEKLMNVLGVKIKPIYAVERPGDIKRSSADISKLKEAIGFTPTPLEKGLREALKAFYGGAPLND